MLLNMTYSVSFSINAKNKEADVASVSFKVVTISCCFVLPAF